VRGPSANPIAKSPSWHKRPVCPECAHKIRRPRPGDVKICSRCKERLPVSDFAHNAARADHRETYCRPCRRAIQNKATRRIRGKAQPISDFSPVGDQSAVVIGQYVSQAAFTDYRESPASIGPHWQRSRLPTSAPCTNSGSSPLIARRELPRTMFVWYTRSPTSLEPRWKPVSGSRASSSRVNWIT
jgi:hypothetical protein